MGRFRFDLSEKGFDVLLHQLIKGRGFGTVALVMSRGRMRMEYSNAHGGCFFIVVMTGSIYSLLSESKTVLGVIVRVVV